MIAYMFDSWTFEAIVRLFLAMALGAVIGLEREFHGRSAGMRTHLLVCLGACLAMIVSLNFAEVFGGHSREFALQVDPARVAYGVMLGVGFLGAGTIYHMGLNTRGLTTAAGLWCAAAIGLAAGFGMYVIAVVAAGMVVFTLRVLDRVERAIASHATRIITLWLDGTDAARLDEIAGRIAAAGIELINVAHTVDFVQGHTRAQFTISGRPERVAAVLAQLRQLAQLREIKVE